MTRDHDVARVAATIVRSESGGPIRTIVTGRKSIPTGLFYSAKSERYAPWEGKLERDHVVVCEADPQIRGYLAQPFRLEMPNPGSRPTIYIPDMEQVLHDGSIRIVEVKGPARFPVRKESERRRRKRLAYDTKLARAADIFDALRWDFVEVVRADVYREPRWTNSRTVNLHAMAAVPVDLHRALTSSMQGRVARTYDEVSNALGGGPLGQARLHALVVRGQLFVDLDERLRPWSRVEVMDVRP